MCFLELKKTKVVESTVTAVLYTDAHKLVPTPFPGLHDHWTHVEHEHACRQSHMSLF